MASAWLVELSPRCRGEALDGGGEQTQERRGACWGSFLEEAMLELNLRTGGVISPEEGLLGEDAKCAQAWRRGCMSHIYGTSGSH